MSGLPNGAQDCAIPLIEENRDSAEVMNAKKVYKSLTQNSKRIFFLNGFVKLESVKNIFRAVELLSIVIVYISKKIVRKKNSSFHLQIYRHCFADFFLKLVVINNTFLIKKKKNQYEITMVRKKISRLFTKIN